MQETQGIVQKHAGGRPTLYRPEYTEQAYKLCLLGAKDKDLARFFEVNEDTVNQWKIDHPEFSESLKKGKEIADAEVAHSLYHRAKGFEHDEVQVFQYQGEPVIVPITKYYAPDTGAAMAWLKNRQPDKWRDNRDITIDVNHSMEGFLEFMQGMQQAQICDANIIDVEVVTESDTNEDI